MLCLTYLPKDLLGEGVHVAGVQLLSEVAESTTAQKSLHNFVRESSLFWPCLPCIFQPLAGDISVEELEGRLQVGGADVGLVDLMEVEPEGGKPGHVGHRVPWDCFLPPACQAINL